MAAKKSRRRRKRSRSRARSLLLVLLLTGAGGAAYFYAAQDTKPDDVRPALTTVPVVDSTIVDAPNDSTNNGTVAPPVTVHNDTLGDIDGDVVYEDFTSVSPPPRGTLLEVDPALYSGDFIDGVLDDGVYEAFVSGTFDEDTQGINFDLGPRDDELHVYPAFLDKLIFVSINQDPDTNFTLTASTFFELVTRADERVMGKPMLLTVVDGVVVAAEGTAIG